MPFLWMFPKKERQLTANLLSINFYPKNVISTTFRLNINYNFLVDYFDFLRIIVEKKK